MNKQAKGVVGNTKFEGQTPVAAIRRQETQSDRQVE